MMTRLFEDDYIRRCSSLRAWWSCERYALDPKTSLISGREAREEVRGDRKRRRDARMRLGSSIYIYISQLWPPCPRKSYLQGPWSLEIKMDFLTEIPPFPFFFRSPPFFLYFSLSFFLILCFVGTVAKSQNLHSKGTRTARLGRPIVFRNFHLDNS